MGSFRLCQECQVEGVAAYSSLVGLLPFLLLACQGFAFRRCLWCPFLRSLRVIVCGDRGLTFKSRSYIPSPVLAAYNLSLLCHRGFTDDFNCNSAHFFKATFSVAFTKLQAF